MVKIYTARSLKFKIWQFKLLVKRTIEENKIKEVAGQKIDRRQQWFIDWKSADVHSLQSSTLLQLQKTNTNRNTNTIYKYKYKYIQSSTLFHWQCKRAAGRERAMSFTAFVDSPSFSAPPPQYICSQLLTLLLHRKHCFSIINIQTAANFGVALHQKWRLGLFC